MTCSLIFGGRLIFLTKVMELKHFSVSWTVFIKISKQLAKFASYCLFQKYDEFLSLDNEQI